MFLQKAMRYYRLWIYTCNAVLFAAVVVLVAVAARTASHPYFPLLPGPPAYDPTYLYAYLALFLQAGVIQTLGCLGALRLSQKLLHLYWLLLVALLLGDMIVGVVWFLRFPRLPSEVNGSMNATLHKYGYDERSTAAWDSLQINEGCCGVRSPENYSNTQWGLHKGVVPSSCCMPRGARAVQSDQAARHVPIHHTVLRSERPAGNKTFTCARHDHRPQKRGCENELKEWMHKSVETLMILGFCVTTFIKLCFVGILKFEIQEMIEKIKVLQGESANTPDPELAAALGLVFPGPQGETDLLGEDQENNPGNGDSRGRNGENEGKGGAASRVSQGRVESELPGNGKSSIGIREERHQNNNTKSPDAMEVPTYPSSAAMRPTLFLQSNVTTTATADAGGDSDTNSHSALITDTPVRRPRPSGLPPLPPPPEKTRHNGNNNELSSGGTITHERDRPLHELYHVRQTQI